MKGQTHCGQRLPEYSRIRKGFLRRAGRCGLSCASGRGRPPQPGSPDASASERLFPAMTPPTAPMPVFQAPPSGYLSGIS